MRERKMSVLLCVVFMIATSVTFAAMDVIIGANSWPRDSNNRYEWGAISAYSSEVFASFPNAGRNVTASRFGYGVIDLDFDGTVGNVIGNPRADIYNASVMYYAGTGKYYNTPSHGEARFAQTFNLSNPFGWVREYDSSYFGPSAVPTTPATAPTTATAFRRSLILIPS